MPPITFIRHLPLPAVLWRRWCAIITTLGVTLAARWTHSWLTTPVQVITPTAIKEDQDRAHSQHT